MKRRIYLFIAALMALSIFFVACDVVDYKIVLTIASPTVRAGETVQLTSDTAGVTFELTSGSDFATVNESGLISVDADAEDGAVIKAVAKLGTNTSNEVSVAVLGAVVDNSIVLTAAAATAYAGGTVQLTSSKPGVSFAITEGQSKASVSTSGLVTIAADASEGLVIKAVASLDGVLSNTVVIVVIGTPITQTIELTASASTVYAGETIELTSNVEGVTFILDSAESIATVDENGLITVSASAPEGSFIIARATLDNQISNVIYIVVISQTPQSINISAPKYTVYPGETLQLISDTEDVTFALEDNSEIATIDADTGLITVLTTAQVGTTFKAVASLGLDQSNTIYITVIAKPISQTIVLTASSYTGYTGDEIELFTATTGATYSLVESDGLATLDGNIITISESATAGDIIRAMATKGDEISNIVSIVVSVYFIAVDKDEITIKNTDSTATTAIGYSISDSNGSNIYIGGKLSVVCTVPDEELIVVDKIGSDWYIRQIGHGGIQKPITIRVELLYNNISIDADEIVVISIKTPDAIYLPDFLQSSLTMSSPTKLTDYSVGINQPIAFEAQIKDLDDPNKDNYKASSGISAPTFQLLNSDGSVAESGEAVAKVEDGKIKFLKTGRVRVTVSTNSDNEGNEKSVSFVFDVNDHYNVSTWEELKLYLENGINPMTGQEVDETARKVNIVVTEKLKDDYGYAIVPNFVLNGKAETLDYLKGLYGESPHDNIEWHFITHIQIAVTAKDVIIRGNNHPIDFSKMGVINYSLNIANMLTIRGDVSLNDDGNTLPDGEPSGNNYNEAQRQLNYLSRQLVRNLGHTLKTPAVVHKVDIDNLQVFGNTDIYGKIMADGDTTLKSGTTRHGTHTSAIKIGYYLNRTNFEVRMNNVGITNFSKGMEISRAVTGTDGTNSYESMLSNISLDEIYNTGLMITMSQVEINNSEFGFMGATPIEAITRFSAMSGLYENERQTIKLTGTFVPGIPNKNSQYFLDYTLNGNIRIPNILDAVLSSMGKNKKDHVHFTGGAFLFAVLSFSDIMLIRELDSAINITGITMFFSSEELIQLGLASFTLPEVAGEFALKIVPGFGTVAGDELTTNVSNIIFDTSVGSVVDLSDIQDPVNPLDPPTVNTTHKYVKMHSKVNAADFNVGTGMVLIGDAYVANTFYQEPVS